MAGVRPQRPNDGPRHPGGRRVAGGIPALSATADPLHVAIDLGAGSGRALVGGPARDCLRCKEVHRFQLCPAGTRGAPAVGRRAPARRYPDRARARARLRPRMGTAARVGRRRLVGRGLRPARSRGPARRRTHLLPGCPNPRRPGPDLLARGSRRDLRPDRHPVPAVQHAVPVVGSRARRVSRHGRDTCC